MYPNSDQTQIRVLHLSDLHFGPKHICKPDDSSASARGIQSLADLVIQDAKHQDWDQLPWSREINAPLLIVATGDLTTSAAPGEFDQAAEFLKRLASERVFGRQAELQGLYVVPGNHDVSYTSANPSHRFIPYCNFINELFAPVQEAGRRRIARPSAYDDLNSVHVVDSCRTVVLELNSCALVEKGTPDESRGQIDPAAIARLREDIRAVEERVRGWIKIALVHHHPVLLPNFAEPGRGYDSIINGGALLRLLRGFGVQLILHGHKHFPQVFSYDPEPAWSDLAEPSQIIIAGGSAGSDGLPDGTRRCNTYNLLTFAWNGKAGMGRLGMVTRGLIRTGTDGPIDHSLWHFETLKTYERTLVAVNPATPNATHIARTYLSPPAPNSRLEKSRQARYRSLRWNAPVAAVVPSISPGQNWDATVWLEQHKDLAEIPVRVTWSAGGKFKRIEVDQAGAPMFIARFSYWGPVLVQAQLEFADGRQAVGYVYAHSPRSAAMG